MGSTMFKEDGETAKSANETKSITNLLKYVNSKCVLNES
jgi:hypothetical protein